MNEHEQIRYSRQILLNQIGEEGQQKLLNARVLIVGAGGLGVPVASYLAASGIGHIGIADSDHIELSNLHRQVAYAESDIGLSKAHQLKKRLLENNPSLSIDTYEHLTSDNITETIQTYDLVADGCDNFPTRFLVNQACVKQIKPLVSVGLSRFDAQIMAFEGGGQPCYQCLVPVAPNQDVAQGCIEGGILGPVAGLFGSWQALEVIKQVLKLPQRLQNQMLMIDALNNRNQPMSLSANTHCPCCGENH